MSAATKYLRNRFYSGVRHPYRLLEDEIRAKASRNSVLLDAGCGRFASIARAFAPCVCRAIGIDCVDFAIQNSGAILLRGDIVSIPLADASVDIVAARSVVEHLENPERVYREVYRVLRDDGWFIFLTPNLWDYASLIARATPNRWHARIVRLTEGRDEMDTFPTVYRSNTLRRIRKLAARAGFTVDRERCVGQYPSYLMFNPVLFAFGTAYDKLVTRFNALRQLRGWLLIVLKKQTTAAA